MPLVRLTDDDLYLLNIRLEDNHAWVNYNDLLDTCLRGFLKF